MSDSHANLRKVLLRKHTDLIGEFSKSMDVEGSEKSPTYSEDDLAVVRRMAISEELNRQLEGHLEKSDVILERLEGMSLNASLLNLKLTLTQLRSSISSNIYKLDRSRAESKHCEALFESQREAIGKIDSLWFDLLINFTTEVKN